MRLKTMTSGFITAPDVGTYTTKEVARRLGSNIRTVTRFMSHGLLHVPHQGNPGKYYRRYTPADIQYLRCIMHIRRVGHLTYIQLRKLLYHKECWELGECNSVECVYRRSIQNSDNNSEK